jgi:hypothetical protein
MGAPSEMTHLRKQVKALNETVVALEAQIRKMAQRATKEKTPEGICAVTGDPVSGGPSACPHVSIYRYQQQCQGEPCLEYGREYYRKDYMKRKHKG